MSYYEERYSYHFGGLIIDSCAAISILSAADNKSSLPDETRRIALRISNRPFLSNGELVHTWRGGYELSLYRFPNAWVFRSLRGMEFAVDPQGSTINCYTGQQGWSPVVTETLVRRILPRVVRLQNRHVIHGAALTTPYGAILLCGYSHAGKSTLAASLSQVCGWGLLDDDTAILTEELDQVGSPYFKAHPAGVGACLWPDSLEALSASIVHAERLSAHENKFRCEWPNKDAATCQALRAIYRLDTDTRDNMFPRDVIIDSLPPQEGMTLLVKHQVRFDPTDATTETKRLAALARMSSQVRMRALTYPKVYGRLQEVCRRVRDDLMTLAQESD